MEENLLWRVDVRARYEGQDLINVLYYLEDSTRRLIGVDEGGQVLRRLAGNAQFLANAFAAQMLPFIAGCSVDSVHWNAIRVTTLTSVPALRVGATADISVDGAWGDVGLPSTVAVCISKTGVTATRRGRGWFHVGGYPIVATSAGLVNVDGPGTPFEALDTWRGHMTDVIQAAGTPPFPVLEYQPILVSKRDVAIRPTIRYQPLRVTTVRLSLRTQRSREQGHGRRG